MISNSDSYEYVDNTVDRQFSRYENMKKNGLNYGRMELKIYQKVFPYPAKEVMTSRDVIRMA